MSACTVLIVEDDEEIRETLKLALEMKGYIAVTASNGKEGIETLPRIPRPCLILLDLMMPVMDGWGFVDALGRHRDLATIPVVVVTAFSGRAGTIKAKRVITKPVGVDVLYATVREFCGPGEVRPRIEKLELDQAEEASRTGVV